MINEGYDNLQIQHRLPVDTARAPLQLHFPEGHLVGISKRKLLVTVSFTAKKPMAFTAKVDPTPNPTPNPTPIPIPIPSPSPSPSPTHLRGVAAISAPQRARPG